MFKNRLNCSGSGEQGQQSLMRFAKRRQSKIESTDKLLDDLEVLNMRSQSDKSKSLMKLTVISSLIDGVKNEKLRTMLVTQ